MKKILIAITLFFALISNSYAYKVNATDNAKLYTALLELGENIDNTKNPDLVKKELKNKVEKIIIEKYGKIENVDVYLQSNFSSKYKYLVYQIYYFLQDEGPLYWSGDTKYFKLLENEYAKLLVFNDDIEISDSQIYYSYDDGGKYILMEFIPHSGNLEKFLQKKYVEKRDFLELLEHTTKSFSIAGGKKYFLQIQGFDRNTDYNKYYNDPFFTYINFYNNALFEKVNDRLIVFTQFGQDSSGIEYASIEFKK